MNAQNENVYRTNIWILLLLSHAGISKNKPLEDSTDKKQQEEEKKTFACAPEKTASLPVHIYNEIRTPPLVCFDISQDIKTRQTRFSLQFKKAIINSIQRDPQWKWYFDKATLWLWSQGMIEETMTCWQHEMICKTVLERHVISFS